MENVSKDLERKSKEENISIITNGTFDVYEMQKDSMNLQIEALLNQVETLKTIRADMEKERQILLMIKDMYESVNNSKTFKILSSVNQVMTRVGSIFSKGKGEKASGKYDNIKLPVFDKVKVSIIIPVYNQFDFTYNCIKSILENTKELEYEVILADDCSTDETQKIENIIEGIKRIETDSNVRFLRNCNNAAKHARGEYIYFLNNDTLLRENAIEELASYLDQNPEAGIAGSKLIYPDGRLQEAGGIVWRDGSAWNYGNGDDPEKSQYKYVREADYISGASLMIRRTLWEKIGGFDERYAPNYYEDPDLCFEVRRHGYKVMLIPSSVIVHFEGISNGTNTNEGLKQYQVTNKEKFHEKWKDTLEKENHENGENLFIARDRSKDKKHILVIDHHIPKYDQDAGGRCTYMYLKLFVSMGLKVSFLGDYLTEEQPYTKELEKLGIEVYYGEYYFNHWRDFLRDQLKFFDYVYLQRPHISVKYIDIIKKYKRPDCKLLYFAHDLHHIREEREYEITGDELHLQEAKKWKGIEYYLFDECDVGHVVGSFEQQKMQEVFPGKPIRNIPLYIYENIPDIRDFDFANRQDILYVGGFGHHPNVDAVLWFAKEVMPLLLEKNPSLKWHIVGGKAGDEIKALSSDNIILEGFVSDKRLKELYNLCRVAVVPLRYGAGVKGKVLEACYYQTPLVTTSIGAEGLDTSNEPFVVEDDAKKMAEAVLRLYEDDKIPEKYARAGKEFIERNFTLEKAKEVIGLDINL